MLSDCANYLDALKAVILEQMVFRKGNYFLVVPKPVSKGGKRYFRRSIGGDYYTHAKILIQNPKDADSVKQAYRRAKARAGEMKAFEKRDDKRAAKQKKRKKSKSKRRKH